MVNGLQNLDQMCLLTQKTTKLPLNWTLYFKVIKIEVYGCFRPRLVARYVIFVSNRFNALIQSVQKTLGTEKQDLHAQVDK